MKFLHQGWGAGVFSPGIFSPAFLCLLFYILFPADIRGDTKIVDGNMEFRFEVHSADEDVLENFYEYENNSNSQKVIERKDGRITVLTRADLSDFSSDVPFPVGERYRGKEFSDYLDMSTSKSGEQVTTQNGRVIGRQQFTEKTPLSDGETGFLRERAEEISEGAQSQHEAVERIMRYVRGNVSYKLNSPTNPVEVLRGGEAHCEGYSNAAALLARSIGIPAKVMDSYIPPGHMWGFGLEGAGGYHAHVEIYYEDAGWVSYDPQATVHYVDPFHIVNYPRRTVKIIQLGQKDERRIVDRLYEPENWDNFYMRRTEERQNTPLLVGTIHTREGALVEDSFRTGEWVYRRTEGGEGEGIRILANGSFAVSPQQGERGVTFFYRDDSGGWLEETVEFDEPRRRSRTYRLDKPEEGYTIRSGRSGRLYVWFKDQENNWKIDEVDPGRDGSVFLLSERGSWIVSGNRQAMAQKYLLATRELEKGEGYAVEELPRYFDPGTLYIHGSLPEDMGGGEERESSVKLVRKDGARTDNMPIHGDGTFAVPLPEESFTMLLFEKHSALGIKRVGNVEEGEEGEGAHVYTPEGDALREKYERAPSYPPVTADTVEYRVETGTSGAVVYLVKRIGGRFSEFGRTEADKEGTALLYVDPGIAEEEDLYILYGTPQIKGRAALPDSGDTVVRFE
ncbi:MAG: transglutaminase-like domain-containing protein [Spirochaetaceae bacterium]